MKKEKNSIIFFLDFYKRFSIPWWLYILGTACGIVYAEIVMQVSARLVQVNKGELYNSVIIGYVLLNVLSMLVSFARNVVTAYGDEKLIIRARMVVWNKILHLPMEEIDREQPSSYVSAVTNDAEQATVIIGRIFGIVSSVYGFVRACVTLYAYNASLSKYLLLLIPVAFLVFYIVGKLQFIIMRKKYTALGTMTMFFSEHLTAGKYVKAHAMEKKEEKSGFSAIDAMYRADIYYAVMSTVQTLVNSVYTNLVTLVTALGGSRLIRAGAMDSAGINMFSTYSSQMNMYLAELLTAWQMVKGAKGALFHVSDILDAREEHSEEGEDWKSGESKDILLEHVTFAYQKEQSAIKELSVRIPYGRTTAVIGNNGSGKSTVMKLVQGFYRPQGGKILVAGNQIGKTAPGKLYGHFGYVLQNNPLFSGSIRDNIAYGMPESVSLEEVKRAATLAKADEFIEALPEKYDTLLGQAGNRLSGGQKQRIAIARALLVKPEYLIMDEAGANLDHNTYMEIFHALRQELKDRTILFIAHDMREIEEADYIIVMNKGRLEAAGTKEELLQTCKTYQEYVRWQEC